MNCPNCNNYAPDSNYICPNCGKVLQPDKNPADFKKKGRGAFKFNVNIFVILILIVGFGLIIYSAFIKSNEVVITGNDISEKPLLVDENGKIIAGQIINSKNPGEVINIENYVQKSKTTIFDFYSEFCPPCKKISPLLKELDLKREDIVVLKVDINREGIRGIDWGSPVARHYKLSSIPHFVIYDTFGKQIHEGRSAYMEIMKMFKSEGIVQ